MKGARKMLVADVVDVYRGVNGEFTPIALPIAKIASITLPGGGKASLYPWTEVRAKLQLAGKDEPYYYTRQTLEELVKQIETPAEEA